MKNTNRHLQLLAAYAAAAVGVLSSGNAAAAMISTGGTLTGVTPGSVGTGSASINATHTSLIQDFNPVTFQPYSYTYTDTTVTGSIGPAGLSLDTDAQTVYGASSSPQVQGAASGTLGFEITQGTTANFSWSDLNNGKYNPNGQSLVIKAADGTVVLGCVGNALNAGIQAGGCEAGVIPPSGGIPYPATLLQQGSLNLAAGDYSLQFFVEGQYRVGYPDDSGYDFSLNLTPVPLPAGLPLLLSGLAALGASVTRSRSRRSE